MVVELSNLTPPPRVRAKHGDKVYARLATKSPGAKSRPDATTGPAKGK
jgi:hypothetical protein